MLVVLVIVSVLAVTAIPMAETGFQRRHESELRETLRTVRTAIDRFHEDWREGVIDEDAAGVSENGFPETLAVLVDGVASEEADEAPRRYLRRLPENPFSRSGEEWRFIGYTQDREDRAWNREDVYDLAPLTEREALDGTTIANW